MLTGPRSWIGPNATVSQWIAVSAGAPLAAGSITSELRMILPSK
jgi:acetyltransferase-like isoleucine patch superfamily enzyme